MVVLLCFTSCTLPGPPDISPQKPNNVSSDLQDWYIYNSVGMPAHPVYDSLGIWSLDFPSQLGACARYVQTPFNSTTTLHNVTFTFVVVSDAPQYQVVDSKDYPPATIHIFFERQKDNLAAANGRWWADKSKYNLSSYDNHSITINIPLIFNFWTNVYGKTDEQSFNDSLAKIGWIGFTFGGQDFWANGVAMKAGHSKFVLQSLDVK